MATAALATRDGRALAYTRVLSLVIVPFLLVAFVLLYVLPGDRKTLFAWTLKPTMTPMVLVSAYLGGVYFFLAKGTFVSRPPSPRRSGQPG